MFIDLSHNRLKELVVQGLPCSISFLKVLEVHSCGVALMCLCLYFL